MSENQIVQPDIRVILLGTGVPTVSSERFGPSTLVQAGGENMLFDAGRGALIRLSQIDPPLSQVRNIFLTHLHSDHLVGLPDLWLTGWLSGRVNKPLSVWGPRGTRSMMEHLDQAFQYDIRIRLYDDRLPPEGVVFQAEDIKPGPVYEKQGLKVTAIEVDHAPIYPAFGYRIDYGGRSVMLSGDTRFSEHLIDCARGVDVIVHEVIAANVMRSQRTDHREAMERVIAHHTTAEEAGIVFEKIKPRLAVFSHIIPYKITRADLIEPVRQHYSGPVEVGEDLMTIDIGEQISVSTKKG